MLKVSRLFASAVTVLSLVERVEAAPRERFKLGGGAGLSFLSDPVLDLPMTPTFGGFIGYRVSDNVSLEGGIYYATFRRTFTLDGSPVDENTPVTNDLLSQQRSDYNLEATLIINLGRRKQFHPFLLGGGGAVRSTANTALSQPGVTTPPTITIDRTQVPSVHFGGGFDLYFLYNVAARTELRYTLPDFKYSYRSIRFIFGGTFFF